MNLETVKQFYLDNPIDISYLTHPSWRQFRFHLPNKRFFKLPTQIKYSSQLQKWIIDKKPLDVYYSSSCFLAPQQVGAKSDIISNNLLIKSDLVFDIDGKKFAPKYIEKARYHVLNLLEYLKTNNIQIKYIAFSGSKGFHVVCKSTFQEKIEDPLKRENQIKKHKIQITKEITNRGIKIDTRVTVDTRRILRVPGTLNSKSGYICRILTEHELRSSTAREIIKNTKHLPRVALMSLSLEGNDRIISLFRKILALFPFLRARTRPPRFIPYYYASFLSNRVVDTQLFVPIIEFPLRKDNKCIRILNGILETYQVREAFFFSGSIKFAIIPVAYQKRRVEKILKAGNSTNLTAFKKYHQTFTRVSRKIDTNFNEFESAPNLLCHLKKDTIPSKPISNSHLQFLKDYGIHYTPEKNILKVGSPHYIIRHSLIEN